MSTTCVSIIAAVARNRAIGSNGDLAFHISGDLRRFKQLTMGHPIIMGRKTFESFPKGPLPGRQNIVITRQVGYAANGIDTATSLHQALAQANETDETFIIGGGEIYKLAIRVASKIHLTEIDADAPEADTFFPEINPEEWSTEISPEGWQTDPQSGIRYRYLTLTRTKVH